MNIRHEDEGGIHTVFLEGRLDYHAARELKLQMDEVLEKANELVYDLEKVDYLSSAGLRVLLESQIAMRGKGGMRVINVSDDVLKILKISNFDKVLGIKS